MMPDKKKKKEALLAETHELNNIKKTIAVLSGKGGVGKSLVTSLLAVMMKSKGCGAGVLDADITGPSIPKMFGVDGMRAESGPNGINPVETAGGIRIMSMNLLIDKSDTPVIWRGPLVSGAVKQFWTDVIWGELDYLFLDLPPGTGDVPLTVFQSIPLDGIIIVTSPQDLVSLIVSKACNMAARMNIPVIGMIENFSYITCPDCGKEIELFGKSSSQKVADKMGIKLLGKLPVDTQLSLLSDSGEIEKFDKDYMDGCIDALLKLPARAAKQHE